MLEAMSLFRNQTQMQITKINVFSFKSSRVIFLLLDFLLVYFCNKRLNKNFRFKKKSTATNSDYQKITQIETLFFINTHRFFLKLVYF